MSDRFDIGSSSDITTEACAWVAQIESGDLSGSDMAALREWMGRSPRHSKEINEVAALSGQLSILTEMTEPLEDAAAVNSGLRKPRWRPRFALPTFVTACAAVVISTFIVAIYMASPTTQSAMKYQTAIGEIETIALEDGTTVKLNTDSQIEVDFTGGPRRINLVRGEALFDVASNPSRPFQVYSGEAMAEAVGTSFVVRLRDAVTELAVVEGKVAFSRVAQSVQHQTTQEHAAPVKPASVETVVANGILVHAGQILTSEAIPDDVQSDGIPVLPTLEVREIQRKLSWTEGLFDFSETPLDEVVAEISRYNDVKIEFADPNLKALKFGGMFRTGDIDGLLEALQGLGLTVEHVSDDLIVLRESESA